MSSVFLMARRHKTSDEGRDPNARLLLLGQRASACKSDTGLTLAECIKHGGNDAGAVEAGIGIHGLGLGLFHPLIGQG